MIALLLALAVTLAPAAGPDEEVTPPQYSDVWAWCGARFPGQPDMVKACRWGAYEMTPTTPAPTEWRA